MVASASSRTRRTKKGFTLIELLVVVTIIGLLAAMAIPKFSSTRGKAFAGVIKSDLRNLATAEENYFYDNHTYTSNLTDLKFAHSSGVVITVQEVTGKGWSAMATHPASFPLTCAIYVGDVTVLTPATVEGQIGCQ